MTDPIQYMKQSIVEGKHWYISLLEAIGLWTVPKETFNGRYYQYLIAREAFDWLLLAERLCYELNGLAPEEEVTGLLFGKAPIEVPNAQFKELIGRDKHTAFLNYFYGVIVEQTLQLAVEMDIEKERHGKKSKLDLRDEAFERIYGLTEDALLERFRNEKDIAHTETITLTELNEFTYWLFKYRFTYCDNARVASDTKKALQLIEELRKTKTATDKS